MLISKEYQKLERISYELTETEVRKRLLESMLTDPMGPTELGGKWLFDWWDEETQGALVVKLTYVLESQDEVAE